MIALDPKEFPEDDFPFTQFLASQGYIAARKLSDGSWVGVLRMGFNWRLCVDLDTGGIGGNFCYDTLVDALHGLGTVKPDQDPPPGWKKHVETNRCRINGDPSRETIGWPYPGEM